MSTPHDRVRLDPRFWRHVRIEPRSNPWGVVIHLVDEQGELVHERKLSLSDWGARMAAVEDVERFKAEHGPGRYFLYAYDGDDGECIGTLVIDPDE